MQQGSNAIVVKIKNLCEKAKTIKNIEIIVAVILIAIVLLIYASTINNNQSNNTRNVEAQDITQDIEHKLASILSEIDGAGTVTVMITYKTDFNQTEMVSSNTSRERIGTEVKGVIIVAEGANDVRVKLNLIKAAQAVLDINASSIEVFAMKNK